MSAFHEFTVEAIENVRGLIDTETAIAIWSEAVQMPAWEGPDVWIHADLMPGNLITRNGRLAAVIDFDSAGPGDPSRDLIVAWMLLPASARPAFRRATGVDDATWTTTGTISTQICTTTPPTPSAKSSTTTC